MDDYSCPRCGGTMEYEDDIEAESWSEEGEWVCQKCGYRSRGIAFDEDEEETADYDN